MMTSAATRPAAREGEANPAAGGAPLTFVLKVWQRLAGVVAFAPLFFGLAVLRLLTVALPPQLFRSSGPR